jgi:hypothetical protein
MYRQDKKYGVLLESSNLHFIVTENLVGLLQWFTVSRPEQDIIFKQSQRK